LHPPPAPLEDVVDDGLMTIQRASFLRKAGVETIVDNDHFLNPPNRADLLESAIKNISRFIFLYILLERKIKYVYFFFLVWKIEQSFIMEAI